MVPIIYQCQNCGAQYKKWAGKCDECGSWNSITQETAIGSQAKIKKIINRSKADDIEFLGLKGEQPVPPRMISGINEFDRVCGGGLVFGSAILVGGDPGIGKSTLLLQVLATLAQKKTTGQHYYISGEEGIEQIRMRAERLHLSEAKVMLAANNQLTNILLSLDKMPIGSVVIIDSIQTLYTEAIDSAPGTVAQIRTCASELIRMAKQKNITVVLVGHVTKEGAIAGPKVLEHIVDCVLYFEGERHHQFRILRTVKNRFGPTDEIGIFEMTDSGLQEVINPSAIFIKDRTTQPGSVIFVGLEGTRPVLMEIQTLIAPSSFGTPRRSVVGWDSSRLAMIIAVLETRCRLSLASQDIFLNVTGGLRIQEPAADMAVAAALISSIFKKSLSEKLVIIGEVGLGGEIRGINHCSIRLKEAAKLGFEIAYLPSQLKKQIAGIEKQITLKEIATLEKLMNTIRTQE